MTGFLFYACAVVLVAAVGFALHFFMAKSSHLAHQHVTRTEWVLGTILASVLVIPTVTMIGGAIAKGHAVTFHEYWSGLEDKAVVETINCSKDGPCHHEYDCDHYTVTVTKTRQVSDGVDAKGNPKTRTETYTEQEDRYHSCPYVEKEYTFKVTDTMGETYTMGSHWFPSSPQDHRWTGSGYNDPRWGFGMPDLPGDVPTGQPKAWTEAKARIDSGNPGGTTQRHDYKNYILASSEDIYAKHSSAIGDYKAKGFMPKVQTKVYDQYFADKVYFVGEKPADTKNWLIEGQRLNGYVGGERRGDLHVVVVNTPEITDVDEYTQALEAYWQSEELKKDTLSKNGLALVLMLDSTGTTVEKARAFTGMPMGNEGLVQSLQNLEGEAATPELLTKAGPVGALVLAEDEGFTRVEMKNYEYLADSIQVGTGARILIFLVAILLSMGVWAFTFAVDLRWQLLENLGRKVDDAI